MDDKEQCIICQQKSQSSERDDRLVSPQTYESWHTLLEAAKVRSHEPIISIAEDLVENELPNVYYHRKCRSIFTMKRDLKTVRMKRKASESFDNDIGCSSKSKRSCRRPSESRVYSATCIFCDKVK